jgi:hypothetical protein
MDRDLAITFVFIFGLLLGGAIGYEIAYKSYEIGYQEGITCQFQADMSNIVLGLLYTPNSGYYIVNQNYGNFKLNVTNQTEALKYLQKEISPCL